MKKNNVLEKVPIKRLPKLQALNKLSKQLIQSKKYQTQMGQCYYNSFMNANPISKLYPSALYVEGWVHLSNNIHMEHAWIQIDKGILELTGNLADFATLYLPFVEISPKELITMLPKKSKTQFYPLSVYHANEKLREQYLAAYKNMFLAISNGDNFNQL